MHSVVCDDDIRSKLEPSCIIERVIPAQHEYVGHDSKNGGDMVIA